MSPAEISDTLRNLRLSSYETKCYLSLLQKNTLTVPEISKLADIPRSSAYDALEKLLSRGMCTAKPGRTKKYAACAPASFEERILEVADEATQLELEKLTSLREEILERNEGTKNDIRAVLRELQTAYEKSREQSNPLDYIEIIKDPYQIHRRFIELIGAVQENLVGFTKPPWTVQRKKYDEQVNPQSEAVRRGVRIRTIYQMPTDEDEKNWLFRIADDTAKEGMEVRVLERLPMKLMIFDWRIVLFSLEDPVSRHPSLTSAVIEHHALAQSLKILFDTLWERAEDYHILKG
jgi:sugar-specific transcriptional regulator TrmB